MKKNPLMLRCYARPERGHIIGVCVDLDIAVKGRSISEIRGKMTEAISSFFASLDKNNFKDVFPRQVPPIVMMDYYRVCIMVNYLKAKKDFQVFCEQLIPKKFEISPLCG